MSFHFFGFYSLRIFHKVLFLFLMILQYLYSNSRALIASEFNFKDTHREKAPLNKTPAHTKSTNMGIWFVGTTNNSL